MSGSGHKRARALICCWNASPGRVSKNTAMTCRIVTGPNPGEILQRPSIASAMEAERPLVTPLAHDALSARLIARTGFKAFAIGGSALLATRFGLPDIGLIGLSDMTAGI